MTTPRLRVLAALDPRRLATIIHRLAAERRRGRPWSLSLRRRVLVTCIALRTNRTFRELAEPCPMIEGGHGSSTVRSSRRETTHRRLGRRTTAGHATLKSWYAALISRSLQSVWAVSAIVTIHYRGSMVEALCKRHGRALADAGIVACPSSSLRGFEAIESCATPAGGGTAGEERASST
jgi:hypothetical protein